MFSQERNAFLELIARFEYAILVGFLSEIIHDTYIRKIDQKKALDKPTRL